MKTTSHIFLKREIDVITCISQNCNNILAHFLIHLSSITTHSFYSAIHDYRLTEEQILNHHLNKMD